MLPSKDGIVRSVECKIVNAVKNNSNKENPSDKDSLSVSESEKIKIRTTTRGVENIAILHSAPVDLEQPEEDVDYNLTCDTIETDVQSSNLGD